MYSIRLDPETPVFLAPGRFRYGIPGRIGPDGAEIEALDEGSVMAAVEQLIDDGIETLAVTFLFSFLNPSHEQTVRELVAARWPGLPISLSSDVDPSFREYERTVVTAFDAYIKPLINDYLARMEIDLAEAGVVATLQIMQSRGGLSSAAVSLGPGRRRNRRSARGPHGRHRGFDHRRYRRHQLRHRLDQRIEAAVARRRGHRRLFGAGANGRC
jgi:N-methylhydantoinase A/oxoprolinase/acetone carboxylase beta subunit